MSNRGTHLSAAAVPAAAATVLVTAVPVAAWGLMGQQDAEGIPASELDHAFRPLGVPDGTAALLGAIALLLAGAATGLLARATRRGAVDRRWWEVIGPLVVAGLMVGVGWRVLTAGVVGANIGAGLALMTGGPVVTALLLWALVRALLLVRRRPGGDGDGRGHRHPFAPHGA